MQKLLAMLIAMCLAITCGSVSAYGADQNLDYKEIPEVTQEEIDAIESLKSSGRTFSYGALLSTESFLDDDGNLSGYTADLCALLTQLFGIEFVPSICDWNDIVDQISSKKLDFSGDFSITQERVRDYYMSEAIAVRSIALFYREDEPVKEILKTRPPVLGFLGDSVHEKMLADAYGGHFKAERLDRVEDAYAAVKSGEIDAFVCNDVFEILFEDDSTIASEMYSPLIFDSVSLATQNPDLEVIISVFNKYIVNGGRDNLSSLYATGLVKYSNHVLSDKLTSTEKAFIDSHIAEGKKVPVVLESGNYPVSFYNETSKEYQGIVPDLLKKITTLTGLEFESINEPEDDWPTVLAMLESGEASVISELLHTPSREGLFLWPNDPSCVTHYALLSKSDAPNLEANQLLGKSIGVEIGTAYQAMASHWFPDVTLVEYLSIDDAFIGLDRGEIDLIMASEYLLLSQTNYYERPGYKVNYAIDYSAESKVAFNINETVLLSIFNKAFPLIDSEIIERNWSDRVFDYSGQLARARVNTLLISTGLLAAFILLLAVFLIKNSNHRRDLASTVKARTAQLEEETAKISTIYDTIPDFVFSKDTKGRYTSCNHSFKVYADLPEESILGKDASEILKYISDEDLAILRAQDELVMSSDTSSVIEELVTYPNGEQRLLETVKTPLKQNDTIVGMIGISRDITAHKAAQDAALEASQAKGDFLARMSHEIRTPLNAIIGMAQIARNSIGDKEKTTSSVDQMIVSSHHLLGLINNVLDMSKIESGNLEMLNQPLYLQDALRETISIVSTRCVEKDITFANNISTLPDTVILGDKLRLNQVLINLLSNSIKFTDPGGRVEFNVNIIEENEDDIRIKFSVEDSGIGMTEEQMSRLFKPFEQADNTIASRFGGTGLGLSISHNLVQQMGGDIKIESELGEGSVFFFDLLFEKAEMAQAPAKQSSADKDFSGSRILLAEDIEINRYIVRELLAPTGVLIEEATNGCEAVEKFEQSEPGTYQLIFMDIQMPKMDGYEATSKIRTLSHPEAKDIPIIAMTANAYKEDVEAALSAGMNGHVGKPIDMDELMEMLATYLHNVDEDTSI